MVGFQQIVFFGRDRVREGEAFNLVGCVEEETFVEKGVGVGKRNEAGSLGRGYVSERKELVLVFRKSTNVVIEFAFGKVGGRFEEEGLIEVSKFFIKSY